MLKKKTIILSNYFNVMYDAVFLFFTGGSPSLQSTVQVTINIADINDNAPVLTPSTYIATIRENLPVGQSILHVRSLVFV